MRRLELSGLLEICPEVRLEQARLELRAERPGVCVIVIDKHRLADDALLAAAASDQRERCEATRDTNRPGG